MLMKVRRKIKILVVITLIAMIILLILSLRIHQNVYHNKISNSINNYDLPEIEMTYMVNYDAEDYKNILLIATCSEPIERIITPDGNTIYVNDNKNKVALDYKIVSNQQYTFKIETISSNELKEYKLIDNDNNKAVIDQNVSLAYPLILPDRITISKSVSINYKYQDNYYSIDNGVTWLKYTEPVSVLNNCTLLAKSKSSEKIVQYIAKKDVTINTAGDALPPGCYDSNDSTKIQSDCSYYVRVSSEMRGYQVRFKGQYNQHSTNYGNIRVEQFLEDKSAEPFESNVLITGNDNGTWNYDVNFNISEDAVWLKISLVSTRSWNGGTCHIWLYDIYPRKNNIETKKIYIDSIYGSDNIGNGTIEKPYKTLDKIADTGIVTADKRYEIKLSDGTYKFTTKMLNLNCTVSLNIMGCGQNTTLEVDSLYANRGGGSTLYSINLYKLVWHGTTASTNAISTNTTIKCYNVAFNIDFDTVPYSYFCSNSSYLFYNCTLPKKVDNFLRATPGIVKLTNCYGGFTSGYGTVEDNWNYQTNYITTSPSVNNTTYEITDSVNVWKNKGTGTNKDGTRANLGVYGGKYAWDRINVESSRIVIKTGSTQKLLVSSSSDAENLEFVSKNEEIATVDEIGNITANSNEGTTTIFAIGKESGCIRAMWEVYIREDVSTKITMPSTDQYIYIDEIYGNDSTGNGNISNPYKTLDRIADAGIISTNKSYSIVLKKGNYKLTKKIFELNCNKSINIIGDRQNTVLEVESLYANNSGGSTAYSVNLYRLVWHGTTAATNGIFVKTPMNFYNVGFELDFNSGTYGYFISNNCYQIYNCTLPTNVSSLIRTDCGAVRLTNCYGGFSSGYATSDSNWNYQTNYITSSPSVNTPTYEITDNINVWKNNGTGTNTDGTQANLGVYGGMYSWYFDS